MSAVMNTVMNTAMNTVTNTVMKTVMNTVMNLILNLVKISVTKYVMKPFKFLSQKPDQLMFDCHTVGA